MRNFEAFLTCRSCGRRCRESELTLGMLCLGCVERDRNRKEAILEGRLTAQKVHKDRAPRLAK
jgi:hypothetical protein